MQRASLAEGHDGLAVADRVKAKIQVELPSGTMTVSADWTRGDNGTIIALAHGAGTDKDHPFLTGFAAAAAELGFSILRFNFPYIEQGRRIPGPAVHAIATWNAVVDFARQNEASASIWATGKSYGGRMASVAVAGGLVVDGLAYLGYPLHPPGRPEKPRAEHLPRISAPQLFISGTNDPFIQPITQFEDAVASCQDACIRWIEGGGHTFEVKGQRRPAAEIGASLAPVVAEFVPR